MARIGVISISDGRDHVHARNARFIRSKQDALVRSLTSAGHEVVVGGDLVATNRLASSVAREVAAAGVDVTVFYYAVWSFPQFTMLAADATRSPLILVARTEPAEPGLVGMLAAGGAGRRARPGRGRGRFAARVDLRPLRRPADGHEHRGRQHRPVDAAVRGRRRGD